MRIAARRPRWRPSRLSLSRTARSGAGADQDRHRQGGRRRRPAHPKLHRDGQGLLQGRRPGRPLRRAGRPAADDGGPLRQRRFHSDPVRRRPGGAERRQASLHRRPVAEAAVDHRHQAGDQDGRGPQGQDAGLRPRRRRRLRRGRHHARAILQHEGRPRLQGHPVPGRARADRRAGERRHHRRAGVGAARLQAKQAGFNVLLRTGDYLPRAGGTFWSPRSSSRRIPRR